jgi:hypothetical protein
LVKHALTNLFWAPAPRDMRPRAPAARRAVTDAAPRRSRPPSAPSLAGSHRSSLSSPLGRHCLYPRCALISSPRSPSTRGDVALSRRASAVLLPLLHKSRPWPPSRAPLPIKGHARARIQVFPSAAGVRHQAAGRHCHGRAHLRRRLDSPATLHLRQIPCTHETAASLATSQTNPRRLPLTKTPEIPHLAVARSSKPPSPTSPWDPTFWPSSSPTKDIT